MTRQSEGLSLAVSERKPDANVRTLSVRCNANGCNDFVVVGL